MKATSTLLLVLGTASLAGLSFLAGRRSLPQVSLTENEPTSPKSDAQEKQLAAAKAKITELEGQITSLRAKPAETKPTEEIAGAEAEAGEAAPGQVDMKKLFKDAKPLIKSLSAAFQPRRDEMAKRFIDDQVKKFAAKSKLTPEQEAAFRAHLESRDKENKAKWDQAIEKDAGMAELMAMGRGGQNLSPEKVQDEWAGANLTPDQAKEYQQARLTEKSEQITKTANFKMESLGQKLGLSETQKDQVFNILVQSDPQYDQSMRLEGVSATAPLGEEVKRDEAIAAVLTPEQQQKYEAQKQERGNAWRRMMGGGGGGKVEQGK